MASLHTTYEDKIKYECHNQCACPARRRKIIMKKVKYTKSRFAGKGFYIALALSLLAVAVATIIAISRSVTKIDTRQEMSAQSISSGAAQINNNQSDVIKSKSSDNSQKQSSSKEKESSAARETNNEAKNNAANKFFMPLNGDVIKEFSNGELVKYDTMGDWRTHDGIDISAKQSTPVKSIGDGIVCDITNDNMWGTCIVIDHKNQMKSYYCGLNETVQVKLDSTVKAGEVIGSVGTSNQLESTLPDHLHFGMKKDDAWVNPLEYIK